MLQATCGLSLTTFLVLAADHGETPEELHVVLVRDSDQQGRASCTTKSQSRYRALTNLWSVTWIVWFVSMPLCVMRLYNVSHQAPKAQVPL